MRWPWDTSGRFYRRLWQEAEQDRKQADERVLVMAILCVDLLNAIGAEEHPDPGVRASIRKLRHTADRVTRL